MKQGKRTRVLIYKEDGFWFAQALERDIMARGDDLKDMINNFLLAHKWERRQKGGLERLPPAPAVFHEKWESCNTKQSRLSEISDEKSQLSEISDENGIDYKLAA